MFVLSRTPKANNPKKSYREVPSTKSILKLISYVVEMLIEYLKKTCGRNYTAFNVCTLASDMKISLLTVDDSSMVGVGVPGLPE